jgi:hypothetical protein
MGDMKPKYTPGPWHVVPIGNPKKEMTPVVKATDGDLILMAYVWTRGQPNEANARLIAEAPDMADLLRRLVEASDDPSHQIDHVGMVADSLASEAREILARINGEDA